MDNIYWLDRIQPTDCPSVGNTAFNLSQLEQRGYPVVPSFVISATVFWDFIKILGKSEPMLADLPDSSFHVDVDNPHQLQQVARQIRQGITAADLPAAWMAALSSAILDIQAPAMILHPSLSLLLPVKEWGWGIRDSSHSPLPAPHSPLPTPHILPPGILDSYTCSNEPEAFANSLKRVWAELFRARSLFYWQRQGIGIQYLNLAILVQPVWDAIASGTIIADSTEWKIQATWGIGEALTKGEVLPDSYRLQIKTGTVTSQALGSKSRAYRISAGARDWGLGDAGARSSSPGKEAHPKGAREDKEDKEDNLQPTPSENATLREPLRGTRTTFNVQPSTFNPLQAYLVSEEQQKQYALDETDLKQLIELSQGLMAELGATFSLEWTLCQPPGSHQPQLFLTQFILHSRAANSVPAMSTQPSTSSFTPQLVRGLPAAAGQVTAPALVITGESQNLDIIPGRILVSRSVTPDWLPWLKQAVGIVTEGGGMTCHAAIIARELGIPAIVAAVGATQLIQTDELLSMDGDQGEIYIIKDPIASRETEQPEQLNVFSPVTPIATQLLVNLSQPATLERIASLPVDGVGLLRSELMMLEALENQLPDEWLRQGLSNELVQRLAQLIVKFAGAFMPRPVFYRSLDWRAHEFQFLAGSTSPPEPEVNPALGLRGTRRYLSDPTLFDLELAALARVYARGYVNVRLMLPFVRTVEEFIFCRRRVEHMGLFDNPYFQLWIMAEVPSVLFLLPDYVKAGVQGISIGTNDLTQLLLAVDRDRGLLGSDLDASHPAVMRALKQIVQMARNAGIPCSICGQATVLYPELIDSLVRWGITSISVDANDVESTYTAIARAEQRLLLEAARQKLGENS